MAKVPIIRVQDIELDGDVRLWDVMRAALRAKESAPQASLMPAVLILKSNEIIAKVYQSSEEPRTLLVSTCMGIRKISLNWYDALLMLYRTSVLTLQKMEGTSVILFGERTAKEADRSILYAMKWTARQFLQPLARVRNFPKPTIRSRNPSFSRMRKFAGCPKFTLPFNSLSHSHNRSHDLSSPSFMAAFSCTPPLSLNNSPLRDSCTELYSAAPADKGKRVGASPPIRSFQSKNCNRTQPKEMLCGYVIFYPCWPES